MSEQPQIKRFLIDGEDVYSAESAEDINQFASNVQAIHGGVGTIGGNLSMSSILSACLVNNSGSMAFTYRPSDRGDGSNVLTGISSDDDLEPNEAFRLCEES